MKKIPRLFLRDENRKPLNAYNPDCLWVANGEGIPTRKYDGTACAIIDGKLYKRYDNKNLNQPQENWVHCGDITERGKNIYWIPITDKDYYHIEAFEKLNDLYISKKEISTYELCGPKINNNREKLPSHNLIPHGLTESEEDQYLREHNPRTFDEVREVLRLLDIEGIVWHHEDGRMCKETKKNMAQLG